MKTKFLFALVLSFACIMHLSAQDAASSSDLKIATLKAGSGANPTDGQEFYINVVVSTPDGNTVFSSKDMNVPIHGTVGEDSDPESKAMYEAMKQKMQTGGSYRVEVPKDILRDKSAAEEAGADHLVYEIEVIQVSDAQPSGTEMIKEVVSTKGVSVAQAKFDALQASNPGGLVFAEWDMNAAGYEMLEKNKADEAIALFKMNVQLNPNSWNAFDSLGDAYLAKGEKEKAKESFQNALKLNPDYTASQEKLDKL
jgi:tetratricopeptide (TPR) repeat protein